MVHLQYGFIKQLYRREIALLFWLDGGGRRVAACAAGGVQAGKTMG
jgi:hypothetical protein